MENNIEETKREIQTIKDEQAEIKAEKKRLEAKAATYETGWMNATNPVDRATYAGFLQQTNDRLKELDGRLKELDGQMKVDKERLKEQERHENHLTEMAPATKRFKGYSQFETTEVDENLNFTHSVSVEKKMVIEYGMYGGSYLSTSSSSRSSGDFKWDERPEVARMREIVEFLDAALRDVRMPSDLALLDISLRRTLFNVPEARGMPITPHGSADIVVTLKELTTGRIIPVDLRQLTLLVIEIKKPIKKTDEEEYLEEKHFNQAMMLMMGVDQIQTALNRNPVTLLTDLKTFVFFWAGLSSNNQSCVFHYETKDVKIAALLMASIAIEEARKLNHLVNYCTLPSRAAALPIYNRCKLKGHPEDLNRQPPHQQDVDMLPAEHGDLNEASSSVTIQHKTKESGSKKGKRQRNLDDDRAHLDDDDRGHMLHQMYLTVMKQNAFLDPPLPKPLSTMASNMYI